MPSVVLFAPTPVSATLAATDYASLGGVSLVAGASTESVAQLSVTPSASIESLASVVTSTSAATEAGKGVSAALSSVATEAQLGLAVAFAEPYVGVGSVTRALPTSYETLAGLAVASAGGHEALIGLAVAVVSAYERLQGIAPTYQSATEAIGGISRATATPIEILSSLSASGISGFEAAGVPLFAVSTSVAASYEGLGLALAALDTPFMALAALSAARSGAIEALLAVARTLPVSAYELKGYIAQPFASEPAWLQVVICTVRGSYESTGLVSALRRTDSEQAQLVMTQITSPYAFVGYVVRMLMSAYSARGVDVLPGPYDVEIDLNALDVEIEHFAEA